ncbi:hypothetical protein X768_23640 [Mesorhizobium sp. LSJC265A00]|nr:hypothetical protein X768_23640 [Mesorhizobium sp. LSJC265A00]
MPAPVATAATAASNCQAGSAQPQVGRPATIAAVGSTARATGIDRERATAANADRKDVTRRDSQGTAHLAAEPAGAAWAQWAAPDGAGAALANPALRSLEVYCGGMGVARNRDGLVAASKAKSMSCLCGTTRLPER